MVSQNSGSQTLVEQKPCTPSREIRRVKLARSGPLQRANPRLHLRRLKSSHQPRSEELCSPRAIFTRFKKRTEHPEPRYSGAEGALMRRNILEILLLRLLKAKLPTYGPEVLRPPCSHGLNYGLVNHQAGSDIILLGESPLSKMKPGLNVKYFFWESEWDEWFSSVSWPRQDIYTDGSFIHDTRLSGYGIWWDEAHANNAYGPVPTQSRHSSSKAEAYAVFLALLQIRGEVMKHGVNKAKYRILTDCLGIVTATVNGLKEWDFDEIDWRSSTKSDSQIEIIRVAAGLLWDLRLRGALVVINYIKAHYNIMGNEVADCFAKLGSSLGIFSGPQPAIL